MDKSTMIALAITPALIAGWQAFQAWRERRRIKRGDPLPPIPEAPRIRPNGPDRDPAALLFRALGRSQPVSGLLSAPSRDGGRDADSGDR